jgi:(1->4)-alpha-D-glucan 1-alpha-D-glucosylmutase
MLARLKQTDERRSSALAEELTQNWQDGRIKLFLIWKALNFRRQHQELFTEGDFVLVETHGTRQENLVTLLRHHKTEWALVVVPRWLARDRYRSNQAGDERFWGRTEIRVPANAPESWHNALTGENVSSKQVKGQRSLAIRETLGRFPVALLTGTKSSLARRKKKQPAT